MHPSAIAAARPDTILSFSNFDDVPALAAKALHEASESKNAWSDLAEEKRSKKVSSVKRWLNSEPATAMTPELLDQSDPSGDVRGWLGQIQKMLS